MAWKTYCFLFFCITAVCFAKDVEEGLVHGKISFAIKELSTIPQDSCLVVKIQDTRMADGPSIDIASRILRYQDMKLKSGSLSYNITFEKREDRAEYSISATLNMGWCSSGSSDWLHGGDYLTTTSYNFQVKQGIQLYKKDIEMEFYETMETDDHHIHHEDKQSHSKEKTFKRGEDPCLHAPCYDSICISFSNGSYDCKKLETLPCAIPMCADIYEPVCGSNGKTYANECVMEGDTCIGGVKNGLFKRHDGECFFRHSLHQGFLLGAGGITLATVGLIIIFLVWRRNRHRKLQQEMIPYGIKKVAPLDL